MDNPKCKICGSSHRIGYPHLWKDPVEGKIKSDKITYSTSKANTINLNDFKGLVNPGLLEARVEELERRVLVLENLTKPNTNLTSDLTKPNNLTDTPNINDLTPNTAPNKPNIDLTENLTQKEKVKAYQREYMRRKRAGKKGK